MLPKKIKLLLDTHVLLWSLSDHNKLKKLTIDLINDPRNIIIVSVVTLWELEIKRSIGKIKLPLDFNDQIQNLDYKIFDISKKHITRLSKLPLLHHDFFDRCSLPKA